MHCDQAQRPISTVRAIWPTCHLHRYANTAQLDLISSTIRDGGPNLSLTKEAAALLFMIAHCRSQVRACRKPEVKFRENRPRHSVTSTSAGPLDSSQPSRYLEPQTP